MNAFSYYRKLRANKSFKKLMRKSKYVYVYVYDNKVSRVVVSFKKNNGTGYMKELNNPPLLELETPDITESPRDVGAELHPKDERKKVKVPKDYYMQISIMPFEINVFSY